MLREKQKIPEGTGLQNEGPPVGLLETSCSSGFIPIIKRSFGTDQGQDISHLGPAVPCI